MELQLKHIAPYLPYGLKMILQDPKGRIVKITGASDYAKKGIRVSMGNVGIWIEDSGAKPLLHPLSDLTKEIEVNGEKFVPFERIAIYSSVEYLIDQIQTGLVEVIVYNMLVSWHFDVHNLIPSDLAIDINTLNQK